MKGHDQIIAMRKQGMRPAVLWFSDNQVRDQLSVQYEKKDRPGVTDLRFVTGLVVQVEGRELATVKAWAEACKAAGAARVLWIHYRSLEGEEYRAEIIGMGDSYHILDDNQEQE